MVLNATQVLLWVPDVSYRNLFVIRRLVLCVYKRLGLVYVGLGLALVLGLDASVRVIWVKVRVKDA